jgi:hypothetical protein
LAIGAANCCQIGTCGGLANNHPKKFGLI